MRLSTLLLLSAPTLLACSDATAPVVNPSLLPLEEGPIGNTGSARLVSVAYPVGDSLLLTVPAQARRGTPVTIRMTVTSGGCVGADTTVVRISGQTATVVPYSNAPINTAAILCVAGPLRDERTATAVFSQTGEARVRIVLRVGSQGSTSTLRIIDRLVQITN